MDQIFGGTGGFECIGDALAVQSCQQQRQWQSFIITQVFQFVLMYFVLFVLKASHALLVGGLCITIYSTITLVASSTFEVFSLTAHVDLLLLTFVYAISLFAKYNMMLSKRTLCELLDKQKENMVQEKVLRCQAEFTCERLASQRAAEQAGYKCYDIEEAVAQPDPEESTTAPSEVCSAYSAPAAIHGRRPEKVPLCPKGSGDCLPATGVAWVENCPAPRSLNTLMPGERVLCYDNVGKGLTYAEVMDSHPAYNSATAPWVMVTLKDGTQLSMTADHPVAVQPSPEHAGNVHKSMLEIHRRCVRAEDLDTEKDCLMVLKMVATPVASIAKVDANAVSAVDENADCLPENKWITVTVEQPDRHELFVATRDKFGAPGQPIAVGSSDRIPSGMSPTDKLAVKNTFFHGLLEDDVEDSRRVRRSNSAPPSLRHSSTSAPIRCYSRPGGSVTFSDFKCPTESDRLSTLSGTTISGTTESSGCQNPSDVKVGATDFDSTGFGAVARLTDIIRSKAKGIPSVGSVHKSHDACSPCSFHFTWQRNPGRRAPCKASYMCEYCHDSTHHDKWRSKFRKRRHAQPCVPVNGAIAGEPSLQ